MGLFDRFTPVIQSHSAVKAAGQDPFGVKMERVLSPTEALIKGRPTILAGTHNYLGLTFHPDCIEAACHAAREFGTGTTGSRIANGSYAGHKQLEENLSAFFERRHAMVFTTGYQANLGIISTLAGPNDYLLLDADSHASIYDASRLGSATVIRFKHNDPQDLEKRLARIAKEPGNKIIVVEGIYSMLGDTAPLAEFVALKKKYGAYLVVDEAHSFGVLGKRGRGLAEQEGVEQDIDFVVGTFSKSLGAIGGYCVSDHPEFETLRVVCRPYMFTASLPPATIASVTKALDIMIARPELRQKLWENTSLLYDGLKSAGFTLGDTKSPVIAVLLPDPITAVAVWRGLLESGAYVNLALPPATPNSWSMLRCSVSAAHSEAQLKTIVESLSKLAKQLGLFEKLREMAVA